MTCSGVTSPILGMSHSIAYFRTFFLRGVLFETPPKIIEKLQVRLPEIAIGDEARYIEVE